MSEPAAPPVKVANANWNRIFEIAWRMLVLIVAVAIIIIVSSNWNGWEGAAGWQRTDDAYLQTDLTPIVAKVGGYLRALPIQDYQHVQKGQLLAQLVDDDYRAAVVQAQANIQSANAQIRSLQAQHELQLANVAAARAVVTATMAQSEQTERDIKRQQQLFKTGSSSTEAGERLATSYAQVQAQLLQNRAQALAAQRQFAVLDAQLAESQASVNSAKAALVVAQLNLQYTAITAPQEGVITQRQVKPGQLVGAGTEITTLSPIPEVWVIANYRETQLTHMSRGQRAEVTVDTFPGHTLRGHLEAFAPASGAASALLPPDNATGNFTKVVQRIPVKIVIDDTDGLYGRLIPGMSVEARIDARDEPRR